MAKFKGLFLIRGILNFYCAKKIPAEHCNRGDLFSNKQLCG